MTPFCLLIENDHPKVRQCSVNPPLTLPRGYITSRMSRLGPSTFYSGENDVNTALNSPHSYRVNFCKHTTYSCLQKLATTKIIMSDTP